jgi:hypothetical protein
MPTANSIGIASAPQCEPCHSTELTTPTKMKAVGRRANDALIPPPDISGEFLQVGRRAAARGVE